MLKIGTIIRGSLILAMGWSVYPAPALSQPCPMRQEKTCCCGIKVAPSNCCPVKKAPECPMLKTADSPLSALVPSKINLTHTVILIHRMAAVSVVLHQEYQSSLNANHDPPELLLQKNNHTLRSPPHLSSISA